MKLTIYQYMTLSYMPQYIIFSSSAVLYARRSANCACWEEQHSSLVVL